MSPRWWRIGAIAEREGRPWTWTFHVRAPTEERARRLVALRFGDERFAIHICHRSEPLHKASRKEEVAAVYGPYPRSWDDPPVARLRALL
ncbi:MAG: hypothetical protein ACREID_08690 [Planctomycetota bacterium]